MKRLPLAFLGVACVGCATTTYRTAQGTEFREETGPSPADDLRAATPTLLANGAVDLGCPEEHLRAKKVSLDVRSAYLWSIQRVSVYLVEGCGWRASYVPDCHAEYPKGGEPAIGERHVNDYGEEDRPQPQTVCQLEIIGKVELPSPASHQTPPGDPKASAQKP